MAIGELGLQYAASEHLGHLGTKIKKQEVMMSGVSSEDEHLASDQKPVANEGSTVAASCRTGVLKPTIRIIGNEVD